MISQNVFSYIYIYKDGYQIRTTNLHFITDGKQQDQKSLNTKAFTAQGDY